MRWLLKITACGVIGLTLLGLPVVVAQDDLSSAVIESFEACHDGFSTDEVILNDELNRRFIDRCRQKHPEATEFDCNWLLLNLRKAGKLSHIAATRRDRRSTKEHLVVAEFAARKIIDRHQVSLDRLMADPVHRSNFDQVVSDYDPDADNYLARKAVFQLRKTRRLQPELITRIADWGREIHSMRVQDFKQSPELAPQLPGVYIFHDKTGYLYIGHSENVRERLTEHLDKSSNFQLGRYLDDRPRDEIFLEIHSFPVDSRAKETMIRRAYESELIRSRQPKFNILP